VTRNETHGYTDTILGLRDFVDLAAFVTRDQVEMYRSIDRAANPMCGKCDYFGVRQANLSSLSRLVIDKAPPDGKKSA
jgi:hypothetical protein